jgi:hypothetical protein
MSDRFPVRAYQPCGSVRLLRVLWGSRTTKMGAARKVDIVRRCGRVRVRKLATEDREALGFDGAPTALQQLIAMGPIFRFVDVAPQDESCSGGKQYRVSKAGEAFGGAHSGFEGVKPKCLRFEHRKVDDAGAHHAPALECGDTIEHE